MHPTTAAEHLLYTTVKLTTSKAGQEIASGTGFFYQVRLSEKHVSLSLVTNKHVVAGCDQIVATCHRRGPGNDDGPTGVVVNCLIDVDPAAIAYHPDDNVDLCAVSFAGVLKNAIADGIPLYNKYLTKDIIPTDEQWENFDAIEELTMLGCPNGLYDEVNNFPLVRRGISATSIGRRYNGKNEFVVDMACFPGSSGSPIFLLNISGYLEKNTNIIQMGTGRLFLVGILHAGPIINNNGKIILSQAPTVQVASMMHLGYAIRSTELLHIEDVLKDFADRELSRRG